MTDDRDLLDEFGLAWDAPFATPQPTPSPVLATTSPQAQPSPNSPAAPAAGVKKIRATHVYLQSEDIAPGSTATLTAHLNSTFKAEKMIVNETVKGSTHITGVFFGRQNLLPMTPGWSGISSQVFGTNSIGNALTFPDVVRPGTTISVLVTNSGLVPCTVGIVLFGRTVQ